MNYVAVVMAVFSVIAAVDRIFGGRLGLGKEFEKGFKLFGTMALSMIGMIIISPALARLLNPVFAFVYNALGIDPSVIPASLFANDMGGAALAVEVAENTEIGMFNALVVSAMMGATVSFTIPLALGTVNKENQRPLLLGLLCGIVTIPLGGLVAGLLLKISVGMLALNLLPLIIFAAVIALCLLFFPAACVKAFAALGAVIKAVITFGLILGIIRFLTGFEPIKGLATIESAAEICLNATIVMSGAFPMIFIISKLLKRPVKKLGERLRINETSALGFISTLATNVTTFEMMNSMDKRGAMLNSAFAVSAAFTFAGHLAFTMAYDINYLPFVIIGKFVAGVFAVAFAMLISKREIKE